MIQAIAVEVKRSRTPENLTSISVQIDRWTVVQLTTRGLFEFKISVITDTCKLFQKYCCTKSNENKIQNVLASKNKIGNDPAG